MGHSKRSCDLAVTIPAQFIVEADLKSPSGEAWRVLQAFAAQHTRHRRPPTTTFVFDRQDEAVAAARFLTERGVGASLLFELTPSDDQIELFPGYYFSGTEKVGLLAGDQVDDLVAGPLEVALDYETAHILVAPRAQEVLSARGVAVARLPGTRRQAWWRLLDAAPLPEPVWVPHVVESGPLAGGQTAIRSDGREVLTNPNKVALGSNRIARSAHARTRRGTVSWVRPPILSSSVVAELVRLGVRGLEITALLSMDQAAELERNPTRPRT